MKKSKILIAAVLMFLFTMCIAPITTFAATAIGKVEINAVKFNYNAGDKPESYAIRSGDTAYYYDIEYEYWEKMETAENGELVPIKFWYSDDDKNNALAQDKKITSFEEGKSYMYTISLKARDGYTFADNTEVYVNGEKVNTMSVGQDKKSIFVPAIKTIKPTKPIQKQEIDVVEINNVTLKFSNGEKPVFTGTISDDRYKFVFEAWRTNDAGISSVDWFNNDDHLEYWGGKLITMFDKNKTYTYELALVTTAEGGEKWFFGQNTKLKINGQEVGYTCGSTYDEQSFSVDTKIRMIPSTKEITNDREVKASILFDKEISNDYVLDTKKVEVKKELADQNVKYLVDINVLENGQVVKIDNTKMKIRIALPEELKGYKKYEVVYILNNEIKETIPATVEDGYIVFETIHLSEYGIVATEKINNIENPQTGDNIGFYIISGILSIVGLTGAGIFYRRKQTN